MCIKPMLIKLTENRVYNTRSIVSVIGGVATKNQEMRMGVYIFKDIFIGAQYVGSSVNLDRRIREHLSEIVLIAFTLVLKNMG